MKCGIVIFDDFTDIDFFLPWDILNRVRTLLKKNCLEVVIIGEKAEHVSKSGLKVPTTGGLEDIPTMDAVIFCSGPQTRTLCKNSSFLKKIKIDPRKQLVSGVCSGSLFLGALGVLKNKKATTYPTARNMLKEFGADVVSEAFVSEGNICTSASCLSGQYVAHWVISKLVEEASANKILESIQPLQSH